MAARVPLEPCDFRAAGLPTRRDRSESRVSVPFEPRA